jgi:hypothetical protein
MFRNVKTLRTFRQITLAMVLAGAGSALGGCRAWNAWLDMWRWKEPQSNAPANPPPAATVTPQPAVAGAGAPGTALLPRVTVFMITLPLGTFSGDNQVWAQLNEDAIDSRTAVLMAQNGLRAATGAVGRWPTISKLLVDAPGAAHYSSELQTDGRTSIPVITRQNALDQTVVSVDRDHTLQGRWYEKCDNGFRLAMRSSRPKAGAPAELQLQLQPMVSLGNIQVIRPGVGVTGSTLSAEEMFDDLQMTASLTAEQFLVICALEPKGNSFSVGRLWLTEQDKVPATETVLVFVPMAHAPAAGK